MTDIDKFFEPSLSGWVKLIPQRIRSSNRLKEPQEVLERFKKMEAIRDDLKRIERGISSWTQATKDLTKSAKDLAEAVQTPPTIYKDISFQLDVENNNTSALESIKTKIKMIESLIKQKERLEFIRLKGEYAEHRLGKLRKKGEGTNYQIESEKYLHIKKEAQKQRDEILKQVMLVVDKFAAQADDRGVSDLVKPQLQAFKLSQFHVFLNCQRLIQGPEDDQNVDELEQHWNAFTERIAKEIPNQEAGGSFEGSAELLGTKLDGLNSNDNLDLGFNESDFQDEQENEGKKKSTKKAPVKPNDPEPEPTKEYRDSDFDGENISLSDVKTEAGRKSFETDIS